MDSTPGSFVFRNRWAEYFAGLIGDRLVLDSGTGPDLRDLIVIDLTRRRMIYQDSYVDLEPGGPDTPPGTLGLWQGYDLERPAPGCPPPGGLQPGVDSLVWLDVRNGQTRFAGRTRCAVRQ